MGEGVGFGGSGRVPCSGAITVWSHGLSAGQRSLLGPSQQECACQLLWWGVKLGKDVLRAGSKPLSKVG